MSQTLQIFQYDSFYDLYSNSSLIRSVWDLRQELLASLVSLQLVNVLHEDALILKDITLGPQVEAVVPVGEQKTLTTSGPGGIPKKNKKNQNQLELRKQPVRMSWTYMCLSIFLDSL